MILSSTTPGCTAFNTSTCEPCAPGSQYDNSKPSGRVLSPLQSCISGWRAAIRLSWKSQSWCLFLCRYPDVFMLFSPWAVSLSRSVPAVQQRFLSAPIRTTTVLALQPRLLRKVHSLCPPIYNCSSACFVYFTWTVLTVSPGVLYATPARLVPSTTIREQTVAQVALQVCVCVTGLTKTLPVCFTLVCWGISHLLLSGFHSSHQSSTSCVPCALGSFCK